MLNYLRHHHSYRFTFVVIDISRTSHRAIADVKRLSDVDDVNDGAGFNVDVSEEQRQLISSLLALANENPASKLKRFEKKYMVVE